MLDNAAAIYRFVDDYLKSCRHREDPQCKMSDAEVMLAALLAGLYFGSNYAHALSFLNTSGLCNYVLSRSRFSRRLKRLEHLLDMLFETMGDKFKRFNPDQEYVMDSYPVTLCHNMRAPNNKLLPYERKFQGVCVTKHEYFYGLRVHVIATMKGVPVEYCIVPGSWADPHGMKALAMDLPAASRIMCDAGYTSYVAEDIAAHAEIWIDVARKSNAKRKDPPYRTYYRSVKRKRIETVFSTLTQRMGKVVHATTIAGFILKTKLFIWVQMLRLCLFK